MYTCIYMIAPHEVSHHCPLWTICIYIHINKQRRPLNLFTCIHNIGHTRKLQDTKDPPGMPKQVRYFHWIGQCPLVSFQTTETENKATLSTVTLGYCTVTTFFSLTWGSGAVLIKQLNATCLVSCVWVQLELLHQHPVCLQLPTAGSMVQCSLTILQIQC